MDKIKGRYVVEYKDVKGKTRRRLFDGDLQMAIATAKELERLDKIRNNTPNLQLKIFELVEIIWRE